MARIPLDVSTPDTMALTPRRLFATVDKPENLCTKFEHSSTPNGVAQLSLSTFLRQSQTFEFKCHGSCTCQWWQ